MGRSMTTRQAAEFLTLIRNESGIVLGRRDLPLLEAAVARRSLGRDRGDGCGEILAGLTGDPGGLGLAGLIAELAPGVTRFFRDREQFAFVARFLRARALTGQPAPRLWSAGCSTGEEAYTLAMTVHPLLGEIGPGVEILGTDINSVALETARAARYSTADLAPVPPALVRSFFPTAAAGPNGAADDRHAASQSLRRMVTLRKQNLADLPYEVGGPFAAILCRHTMMYFDTALKTRVIREFAHRLESGGVLLTGHQEEWPDAEALLTKVGPGIYKRRSNKETPRRRRPCPAGRNEAVA